MPSRFTEDGLPPNSTTWSYREVIQAARKELVLKALSKTQGNGAAAARLLGLETKYFLRLMKSLQIEKSGSRFVLVVCTPVLPDWKIGTIGLTVLD